MYAQQRHGSSFWQYFLQEYKLPISACRMYGELHERNWRILQVRSTGLNVRTVQPKELEANLHSFSQRQERGLKRYFHNSPTSSQSSGTTQRNMRSFCPDSGKSQYDDRIIIHQLHQQQAYRQDQVRTDLIPPTGRFYYLCIVVSRYFNTIIGLSDSSLSNIL